MIKPITQGDYDGLCGLYCIINAIRLAMAPHRELTHEEVKVLFAAGVRFLARRGSLAEAVHSCVREKDWYKLAAQVVASAQSIADRPILLKRPTLSEYAPVHETLRSIDRLIISQQVPCIFLRGRYRHYSVIVGYTPLCLKLFDSFGYRWIMRSSCGFSGTPTSLHRIHAQSLITVATL